MCYDGVMKQESWRCEICELVFTKYDTKYDMCLAVFSYDVRILMCVYCYTEYTQYNNAIERANISKLVYESGETVVCV